MFTAPCTQSTVFRFFPRKPYIRQWKTVNFPGLASMLIRLQIGYFIVIFTFYRERDMTWYMRGSLSCVYVSNKYTVCTRKRRFRFCWLFSSLSFSHTSSNIFSQGNFNWLYFIVNGMKCALLMRSPHSGNVTKAMNVQSSLPYKCLCFRSKYSVYDRSRYYYEFQRIL